MLDNLKTKLETEHKSWLDYVDANQSEYIDRLADDDEDEDTGLFNSVFESEVESTANKTENGKAANQPNKVRGLYLYGQPGTPSPAIDNITIILFSINRQRENVFNGYVL